MKTILIMTILMLLAPGALAETSGQVCWNYDYEGQQIDGFRIYLGKTSRYSTQATWYDRADNKQLGYYNVCHDKSCFEYTDSIDIYDINLRCYDLSLSGLTFLTVTAFRVERKLNNPQKLLAQSIVFDVAANLGWQKIELTGQRALDKDQKFWLSWVFEDAEIDIYYGRAETKEMSRVKTTADFEAGMPLFFGGNDGQKHQNTASIRFNYLPFEDNAAEKQFGHEVFTNTTRGWSTTRTAIPFIMPEKGQIQSVEIYHGGAQGKGLVGLYDEAKEFIGEDESQYGNEIRFSETDPPRNIRINY